MNRRRAGFTLVETIFATLFIGLTVLAIVNLFPGAYLSIRRSETAIQADLLARSVLDELRTVPFQTLQKGLYNGSGPPFESVTVDKIVYRVEEVRIDEVSGEDFAGLKSVKVTVSYRLGPTVRTVVHETYFHGLTQR